MKAKTVKNTSVNYWLNDPIFEKIKEASEKGRFSVTVKKSSIPDSLYIALRLLGYDFTENSYEYRITWRFAK